MLFKARLALRGNDVRHCVCFMFKNDIADSFIELLSGAMDEIKVGKPDDISADIGYIIDEQSKKTLDEYVKHISSHGRLVAQAEIPKELSNK